MRKLFIVCFALGMMAVIALPTVAPAQASNRTKTGTLTCDISGHIGLIVAAKKRLACLFTPTQPGPREVYAGEIVKFGTDAAVAAGAEMVWTVYAPTNRRFGVLSGNYGGAAAKKAAGANALVGGPASTVTLQPVSVEGQGGTNLAAVVVGLELHPAR